MQTVKGGLPFSAVSVAGIVICVYAFSCIGIQIIDVVGVRHIRIQREFPFGLSITLLPHHTAVVHLPVIHLKVAANATEVGLLLSGIQAKFLQFGIAHRVGRITVIAAQHASQSGLIVEAGIYIIAIAETPVVVVEQQAQVHGVGSPVFAV